MLCNWAILVGVLTVLTGTVGRVLKSSDYFRKGPEMPFKSLSKSRTGRQANREEMLPLHRRIIQAGADSAARVVPTITSKYEWTDKEGENSVKQSKKAQSKTYMFEKRRLNSGLKNLEIEKYEVKPLGKYAEERIDGEKEQKSPGMKRKNDKIRLKLPEEKKNISNSVKKQVASIRRRRYSNILVDDSAAKDSVNHLDNSAAVERPQRFSNLIRKDRDLSSQSSSRTTETDGLVLHRHAIQPKHIYAELQNYVPAKRQRGVSANKSVNSPTNRLTNQKQMSKLLSQQLQFESKPLKDSPWIIKKSATIDKVSSQLQSQEDPIANQPENGHSDDIENNSLGLKSSNHEKLPKRQLDLASQVLKPVHSANSREGNSPILYRKHLNAMPKPIHVKPLKFDPDKNPKRLKNVNNSAATSLNHQSNAFQELHEIPKPKDKPIAKPDQFDDLSRAQFLQPAKTTTAPKPLNAQLPATHPSSDIEKYGGVLVKSFAESGGSSDTRRLSDNKKSSNFYTKRLATVVLHKEHHTDLPIHAKPIRFIPGKRDNGPVNNPETSDPKSHQRLFESESRSTFENESRLFESESMLFENESMLFENESRSFENYSRELDTSLTTLADTPGIDVKKENATDFRSHGLKLENDTNAARQSLTHRKVAQRAAGDFHDGPSAQSGMNNAYNGNRNSLNGNNIARNWNNIASNENSVAQIGNTNGQNGNYDRNKNNIRSKNEAEVSTESATGPRNPFAQKHQEELHEMQADGKGNKAQTKSGPLQTRSRSNEGLQLVPPEHHRKVKDSKADPKAETPPPDLGRARSYDINNIKSSYRKQAIGLMITSVVVFGLCTMCEQLCLLLKKK